MAEEHGKSEGGGGSGVGFALLFFGAIFGLWMMSQGGGGGISGGLFKASTSTRESASSTEPIGQGESLLDPSGVSLSRSSSEAHSETKPLSAAQTERRLSEASREVDKLKEEVEHVKMWGVISPHKGSVRLTSGNARSEDPDTEYLTVSLSSRATGTINMTGWRIESYVTGARATLPLAARLPRFAGALSPILAEPGESVILVTGESPIGTSFHENICTGYFEQYQDFYPSLRRECPRPLEEMEKFGEIEPTDDACYDFVRRQQSCTIISRTDITDADLSASCERFAQHELSYAGCVENHRYDPYFYKGAWRVFLESGRDLWRPEREIIRLLDQEGKTVSVLEY